MSFETSLHNPQWKHTFLELKETLSKALEGLDFDIQHVGSTAIEGLDAKPIIDIDIIIGDKEIVSIISEKLVKLNYINRGDQGIEGRIAFRQTNAFTPITSKNRTWMEHHLYLCMADSIAVRNHLLFRDALLNDTALVDQYNMLKHSLIAEVDMTRANYNERKTHFVIDVLRKAGMSEEDLNHIIKANLSNI